MTFWSVLLALAWDRLSALHRPSQFERLFGRYADWLMLRCNAGTPAHGWLAWAAAVLLPALLVGLIGALLSGVASLLGLAWAAAVLYFCLGFQQVVEATRLLAEEMLGGDPVRMRDRLAGLASAANAPAWRAADAEATLEPSRQQMAAMTRQAIAQVLHASLERVFGVVFWFVLLGPFGALLYALSRRLGVHWLADGGDQGVGNQGGGASAFQIALTTLIDLLDWLPARLLAFSFAVVGNFDDAMLGWRSRTDSDAPRNEAVVRAAGFGALGLNDITPGPEYLPGILNLVTRAALLWLAVLGLLWLGGL